MIRSIVVLPQPEGPTNTPTSPALKRKIDTGDHVLPLAGGALERLACDIDLKLHGAATGMRASNGCTSNVSMTRTTAAKRQRIGK